MLQFRVAGMTESDLDQLIAPVYTKYTNPVTTVLAAPGDIQVHLRARCEQHQEAEALVKQLAGEIETLLGARIYSRAGETIEEIVGQRLKEKNATISVAESCTGGLVAERITRVAGSSAYFNGGFLVYNNRIKANLLGIDPRLIEEHTEVSEPVAGAMADAAREKTGSTYAISMTGYAGPDGGTETNPVGTVFIGLAAPEGTDVRRVQFFGDRARIRTLASNTALDWLRRKLES
jgi:nicotinamide-nucleotide amidase